MPNKQTVTFNSKTDTAELRQRAEKSRSNLIAFFDYNRDYANGRHLLYHEFPAHYVYNKKKKAWTSRKKDRAVDRIYHINPGVEERFFLRIFFITMSGPTSFKYLRIVDGVLYGIFKETCLTRGLITDNNE